MDMRAGAAAALLPLLLLSACAPRYRRISPAGGYSDVKLGDNVFRIFYRSYGWISAKRAADYAMLRAAELTLDNGFKYFIPADPPRRPRDQPEPGDDPDLPRLQASLTVTCFAVKPDLEGAVYDAAYVVRSLRKRYRAEPED